MKNSMQDVVNNLIETMERLKDDDLTRTPEELDMEIRRATAMANVGDTIVDFAKIQLEVVKMQSDFEKKADVLPELLQYDKPSSSERYKKIVQ